MKRNRLNESVAALFLAAAAAAATARFGLAAEPGAGGHEEIDRALGSAGKELPGDVVRYSWPRTDLQVEVAGMRIEPPLALGSWAAFHGPAGGEMDVMGDLALLGSEVAPVARALEAGGFEILAVHNHLIGESPRIVYLHYGARGAPAALARSLHAALAKSATPLTSASAPVTIPPETEKIFARVQEALGRRGSMTPVAWRASYAFTRRSSGVASASAGPRSPGCVARGRPGAGTSQRFDAGSPSAWYRGV